MSGAMSEGAGLELRDGLVGPEIIYRYNISIYYLWSDERAPYNLIIACGMWC